MQFVTRTLGQICDEVDGVIRTGPFGSQLHESDYKPDGLPVVMPKNLIDGQINTDGIARIGEEDDLRLKQHKLKKGDIVYGRRGDIGRRALITNRDDGWLCGTGCLRISLGCSVLNSRYLYYYLAQPDVVKWIANQAIGATMPNLNTTILRSVPIRYPDLLAQSKIAAILYAYDDLIDDNRRRIAILESMAQMIYCEWFESFHFPGHERAAITATPARRPVGWVPKKFAEAVDIDPTERISKETEKLYVAMEGLSTTSMLVTATEKRRGNGGSKFRNGDTLFARITPCLENGKTGFVQFLPSNDSVGIGSTEFIVFRSKTVCPEYVYLLSRQSRFRDLAIKSMSGASGRQRVDIKCFDKYLIAQPPSDVLHRFSEIVRPMFHETHDLNTKNDLLRRTRELLLRKLLSGELDVAKLDIDTSHLDL